MSAEETKVDSMDTSVAASTSSPAVPKASSNGSSSTPVTDKTSASEDSPVQDSNGEENNDTSNKKVTSTPKPSKNGSAKKAAAASTSKSPRGPRGTSKTFIELVHEAIATLKDRTGSSTPAIMKYLVAKYPNLEQKDNPNNRFKKNVMTALKSGTKVDRFQKIKASYKINGEYKKKIAAAQKRKVQIEIKKRKDRELAKKKEADVLKQQQLQAAAAAAVVKHPIQAKIDMLKEKDPDSAELKKLLADRRKKEEAEKRKKYVAERLKRRRFPMEDTKLHAEDKELGAKPAREVGPKPQLPFLFSLTETGERRTNRGYAAAASKSDTVEKDARGLVSDMFQVYHFFRGDVHYVGAGEDTAGREIVPAFSLKHLIHAVDDILNGTAKRARMVPPLIVHLFVTCLQMLTAPPDEEAAEDDSKHRRQLQKDFAIHLSGALSPTSWPDVCFLYMDAVHRHFTTSASVGKNVLQGLPIDSDYLLGVKDDEDDDMPFTELPEGYPGYFGGTEGSLAKAHVKLERVEPWLLTAEDLMALLRALTDDVLSRKPEISEDISNREEAMYELLKVKRAADSKLRKVRLAFEGPKKPYRPRPSAVVATSAGNVENGQTANKAAKPDGETADMVAKMDDKDASKEEGSSEDANNKSSENGGQETSESRPEVVFKPTATKKQFLMAEKAQQKADDAYEKGVRSLMARTEPVGHDRNHNGVFCFRHDPEVLYVEMVKPATTSDDNLPLDMLPKKACWHVITKKSVFDQFTDSLDLRGKREGALHEEVGSLRRFLHDDIKERANAAGQLKDKENLKKKLENAKLKCDEEEGRRSGRLAGRAEEELEKIEDEIIQLEQKMKSGAVVEDLDYGELTGLELLRSYDSVGKVETRKTREKKVAATSNTFKSMQCSKLFSSGNIDGTGFMGMLVAKMLELEEACDKLVPWERTDVSRQTWISDLENLVFAWNAASPSSVGPTEASSQQDPSPRQSMDGTSTSTPMTDTSKSSKKRASTGGSSDSKRMKTDEDAPQTSSFTVSQAIAKLRRPLLDLEKRIFEITGLAMAANDAKDADDNMSTNGEEEDADKESKEKRAWKKIINKMINMPCKRHTIIKELVVEAIAAARKAQLKAVVGQLRAALLEFHPNAAGACKSSALKVLESHGGYEYDADDDDEEEEANDDAAEPDELELHSSLCAEAVIVNSSLDGIEDAGHADWVDAVKSGKTLSRMACLVTAFVKRAKQKLAKVEEEQADLIKAVSVWEKEEERHLRNEAKSNGDAKPRKPSNFIVSEVWANVEFTDEIVMAKVEPYPWWPAKLCIPLDVDLEASLKSTHRSVVSLVGESGGLRVIETSNVRPFTGESVEDEEGSGMSHVTKDTKTQLDDCMTMARRILRSHSTKKGKKSSSSR